MREGLADKVGHYRRCFRTPEGVEVLGDLREWSKIDEPTGCALTHEEYAYRAGMQDLVKYIEAVIAD